MSEKIEPTNCPYVITHSAKIAELETEVKMLRGVYNKIMTFNESLILIDTQTKMQEKSLSQLVETLKSHDEDIHLIKSFIDSQNQVQTSIKRIWEAIELIHDQQKKEETKDAEEFYAGWKRLKWIFIAGITGVVITGAVSIFELFFK